MPIFALRTLTHINMEYKIITLVENCVYGRGLQAEHGLSLYIETPEVRLLFDAGASGLFVRNARLLGVDLQRVDCLILSHGHSDHSGGLRHFLELNGRARVACRREAFLPKFKDERENGMDAALVKELDMSRFHLVDGPEELVPGVCLFPAVAIADEEDTHFERFYVGRGDDRRPDRFPDEMAVALLTPSSYSVLSACSHRGITNVLRAVRTAFPSRTCDLILGGFHIHNAERRKYEVIADCLRRESPRRIGVCHCTGVDKHTLFCRDFGEKVFYNYVGRMTAISTL